LKTLGFLEYYLRIKLFFQIFEKVRRLFIKLLQDLSLKGTAAIGIFFTGQQ